MIKVTLITNAGRKYVMASDDATPRSIFDENNVNYGVGKPAIDSVPISMGQMDTPLSELVGSDTCYLTCMVKADNAAKATVTGSACVIVSDLKKEDLDLVKKYRPEELVLYKGEGKEKEPVFAVGVSRYSDGHLSRNGAEFGTATTADGNATITIPVDPTEGNFAVKLEDAIGVALLKIDEIEAKIPAIMEEIHAEQARVREHITIL